MKALLALTALVCFGAPEPIPVPTSDPMVVAGNDGGQKKKKKDEEKEEDYALTPVRDTGLRAG